MRKELFQSAHGSSRLGENRRRHLGNFLLLGRRQLEAGGLEEARRLLLRALECDPHSADALRMLSGVEFSQGNLAAAQEYLAQAIAQAPDDPDILFLQGNMALSEQNPAAALAAYTRALEIGGAMPDLTYNCALAHLMLGQSLPAANLLSDLLVEQPDHARACDALGCALHQLKDFEAARNTFLRALEIDPMLQEARDHLAQLLLEVGNTRQARQVLETALTMDPDRPSSRHLLGMACAGMNDFSEAIAQWESVIANGGDSPETRYLLANAYLRLPDRPGALRTLHALAESWPSHVAGQLQLALLLLEDGEFAHGWEHLAQAQELDPTNTAVLRLVAAARLLAAPPQKK